MNYKIFGIIILLLLLFFNFFIFYYPIVGDGFDYWHMSQCIRAQNLGFMQFDVINAGFYTYIIIINLLTAISYDKIPMLPLQIIPSIFLLMCFLNNAMLKISHPSLQKRIEFQVISVLAIYIYFARYGNSQDFTLWCHGIGFILALSILFLSLQFMTYRDNKYSLLIIILIIMLNFISYKFMSFILIFLFVLLLIEYLSDRNATFLKTFMIGAISLLSFNTIIYHEFFPRLRMVTEENSQMTFGFIKLFSRILSNKSDPLDFFYYHTPELLNYLYLAFLLLFVIIFLSLMLFLLYNFSKLYKMEEKIFLSFLFAIILIIILYSSIGVTPISFLILGGCIGLAYIYRVIYLKYRYVVLLCIFVLISINITISVINNGDNYYSGLRDSNAYEYLEMPSRWYITKITSDRVPSLSAVSDPFTGGFIAKELAYASKSKLHNVGIFSRTDMLFLLNRSTPDKHKSKNIYLFNFKLHHFSSQGWQVYKSWSKIRNLLDNNAHLNSVFSSGDLGFYCFVE